MHYCRIFTIGLMALGLLTAPAHAANISRWVSACHSDKSRAAKARTWQILPPAGSAEIVYEVAPADYTVLIRQKGAAKARPYLIDADKFTAGGSIFAPLPGNANIKQAIIPLAGKDLQQLIFRYQETSLRDGIVGDGRAAQYGKGEAEADYGDKVIHYACDITLEFDS